jgi:CBS domain-containing protein/uncharacterized protein (DUF2267 family)/uncharacterized cupin superfamily protein
MKDSSVIKVDSAHSPRGPDGEKYLASGVRVSMRFWDERAGFTDVDRTRDYEVVGYVLGGRAELHLGGQMVVLAAGDSYVVPRGARHHYRILDHFRAVETTSPPAQVHGRDLTTGTPRRATAKTDLTAYRNAKTIVLPLSATAYDAARAMAEHQIGAVLVAEHNQIFGIVTDRDLVLDVVSNGTDAKDTPVGSVMRRPVATVDIDADLEEAVALMRVNSCRRLPVTEDGRIVGIVTLDDLIMDHVLDSETSASIIGAQLELAAAWKERNRGDEGLPEKATVLGRHLRALKRHRARAGATYRHLVRDVQNATGLRTKDAAETALLIVLDGICRRIPQAQADHLLAQLSSIARDELEPLPETPEKEITAQVIESELRDQLHLSEELASTVLSTVCAVIARHLSLGQTASARGSLPTDLRELFPGT